MRRDFANGEHVVIVALLCASKYLTDVHRSNFVSIGTYDSGANISYSVQMEFFIDVNLDGDVCVGCWVGLLCCIV